MRWKPLSDRAALPPGLGPVPHVPGRTPRPDAAVFAPLKAGLAAVSRPEDLAETEAFGAALTCLDAGYDWEAHELLEAVWLACPPAARERRFVQALIQIANAQLKLSMGRPDAAMRLCAIAEDLLAEVRQGGGRAMGLGVDAVAGRIEAVRGMVAATRTRCA